MDMAFHRHTITDSLSLPHTFTHKHTQNTTALQPYNTREAQSITHHDTKDDSECVCVCVCVRERVCVWTMERSLRDNSMSSVDSVSQRRATFGLKETLRETILH